MVQSVKAFLSNNQVAAGSEAKYVMETSFDDRRAHTNNIISKRLFETMLRKQSNLCVAVDQQKSADIISICKSIGQSVVAIKLHMDFVDDWTHETETELKKLADGMDFLLFEDRKL